MKTRAELFHKLYGAQVPLNQRLFNILMAFSTVIGVAGALTCIFIHSSVQASILAAVMTVLILCLWLLELRFPERRSQILTAILLALDLAALPAIYLCGGSIHSGISAFFALALILTFSLVPGRHGFVLTILQSIWILCIYGVSYILRTKLVQFPSLFRGSHWFDNVAVGSNVLLVAIALAVLAKVLFSVFRQESHSVEENIIEISRLSEIDSLTGLYNRRAMYIRLRAETARADKKGLPLSLLLLDIDDFKRINDQYGHLAGDRVLAGLGELLRDSCSGRMTANRFGGEEFILLLPNTSAEQAADLAETLREKIARTHLTADLPKRERITVSIGVSAFRKGEGAEALVSRADRNMYRAKEMGKNRVFGP